MKIILAILFFASVVFAIHNPLDPVTISIAADGVSAKNNNASWATSHDGSLANLSIQGGASGDSAVLAGKWGTAGLFYSIYRSFFFSEDSLGTKYIDSFTVAYPNAVDYDSLTLALQATNAVDSAGCTGMIYALIQSPCVASNAVHSSVSSSDFNDWRGAINGGVGEWVLMDSVRLDTTLFGIGDQDTLTFTLSGQTLQDYFTCARLTQSKIISIALLTCWDYSNVEYVTATDSINWFRTNLFFTEATGTANDPVLNLYWTEVEASSNTDDGWQSWGIWNAWGKW